MTTTELPIIAPETWTVVEILFGGGRRVLAEHLTFTQRCAWPCPRDVVHIVWERDAEAHHGPPEYHPED